MPWNLSSCLIESFIHEGKVGTNLGKAAKAKSGMIVFICRNCCLSSPIREEFTVFAIRKEELKRQEKGLFP